jgi:hypothetical protein
MDGSLFYGLVHGFVDGGKRFLSLFLVLGFDQAAKLFDLGAQGGFVFLVDRVIAEAGAMLPFSRGVFRHNLLLEGPNIIE